MPLAFLNSLALLGFAGAAIPLVIHLIQKKPAVPRPFAAIEFILRSYRKSGRRYKIKQFLLLLLRMIAICLLTLTIAGPVWKTGRITAFAEKLPTHWVIIVDDSFSMGYGSNFQRAKNAADKILGQAGERDKIDLLLISGKALSIDQQGENSTPEQLKEKIGSLDLAYLPGSIINALEEARKVLRGSSPALNQRIVLITDLTANSWHSGKIKIKTPSTPKVLSEQWGRKPLSNNRLEIIDVGDSEGQPNLAVKEVKVLFPPGWEREMAIIDFKVVNYSNEDADVVTASLLLNRKEVEKGFVKVAAGKEASKRFYYPLQKGKSYQGAVAISSDKLKIDDISYFSVFNPPPSKVLIVNGDPGTSLYTSEVYYLERALFPSAEGDSPFRSQTMSSETLTVDGKALDEFSCIIISNVGVVSDDFLVELSRFVREGGGILITVGDKTVPSEFNRSFNLLLPQKLDKINHQEEEGEGLSLQKSAETLEPLQKLLETQIGKLATAKFYTYFSLVPNRIKNPRILLAFSNGAPALLESTYGAGKVLLFTSTIDRDWNNLPIQTAYLPFVHRVVDYLSKNTGQERGATILSVGDPYRLTLNEGEVKIAAARIIDPENRSHNLLLVREGLETKAEYIQTDLPGHYRLVLSSLPSVQKTNKPDNRDTETPFVVNVDTQESDLRRLSEREIETLVSPLEVKITKWDKVGSPLIEQSGEDSGVALWSFFLFLLTGVLLVESFVANK